MWRKGVYALRRAARVIAGAAGVGMFASMQALAASGHAGASQKEENSGRGRDVSQGKYESPELASLTRVVAETLDEICMSGKNDVVLAVTGENCQTCAYIKPVARQLARVFEGDDRVVIGTMDGDKNFKRGFFDETVRARGAARDKRRDDAEQMSKLPTHLGDDTSSVPDRPIATRLATQPPF